MPTKLSIRPEIEKLSLPTVALDIFDGQIDDCTLGFYCKDPFLSISSNSSLPDNYLPIWECGTTVTTYNRDTNKYSIVSLEEPENPATSNVEFAVILELLFTSMWECEESDEYLKSIASRFDYPHIDRFLAQLESNNEN